MREWKLETGGELVGIIVVDEPSRSRGHGGLRIAREVRASHVRDLARTMSLKYRFLRLPFAGAKATIQGDPDASPEDRRQRLAVFAEAFEPVLRQRLFVPGADMGTSPDDIRRMLAFVGLPVKERQLPDVPSGEFTASSVVASLSVALESRGRSLAGRTIAVEGFGAVGSQVACRLANEGASIVAVSTSLGAIYDPDGLNIPALCKLASTHGAELVRRHVAGDRLHRSDLLELPVDVVCPCAEMYSIDSGSAPSLQAAIVCPGANNPITPEAEGILLRRGVTVVPDFVANSGGVLGNVMAFACIDGAVIHRTIDSYIRRRLREINAYADKRSLSLRQAAAELCPTVDGSTAPHDAKGELKRLAVDIGLEAHRRGWLPRPLVAAASLRALRKRLA